MSAARDCTFLLMLLACIACESTVDSSVSASFRKPLTAGGELWQRCHSEDLCLRRDFRRQLEQLSDEGRATELVWPMPAGGLETFYLQKTALFTPSAENPFPRLLAFRGGSKNGAVVRMVVSEEEIRAYLFDSHGQVVTLQRDPSDVEALRYQFLQAAPQEHNALAPKCQTFPSGDTLTHDTPQARLGDEPEYSLPRKPAQLTTYRLAVATSYRFSHHPALGKGTTEGTLLAVASLVNGVNEIFGRDLGVEFRLAASTHRLFALTDKQAFNDLDVSGSALAAHDYIYSKMGPADFDLAHTLMFGADSGAALLASACRDLVKPMAASSVFADSSSLTLFAHELAHQLGALHSFNTLEGFCGFYRDGESAFEPGGGNTLMTYGGECGYERTTDSLLLRFHGGSIRDMQNTMATRNCGQTSSLENAQPRVQAERMGILPKNTPFILTAYAYDEEAERGEQTLWYAWDQIDAGGTRFGDPPLSDFGDPPDTTRPLFQAVERSPSSHRIFPDMKWVLGFSNQPPLFDGNRRSAETLPSVTREMNFMVTVGDGFGGLSQATVTLQVDGESGPFQVTRPNTSMRWPAGSTQQVTWDVAHTASAPVQCATVRILLSVDGGATFPWTLARAEPNDGAAHITLPSSVTSQARIKVEAEGNIFFDVSDVDFAIEPAP